MNTWYLALAQTRKQKKKVREHTCQIKLYPYLVALLQGSDIHAYTFHSDKNPFYLQRAHIQHNILMAPQIYLFMNYLWSDAIIDYQYAKGTAINPFCHMYCHHESEDQPEDCSPWFSPIPRTHNLDQFVWTRFEAH